MVTSLSAFPNRQVLLDLAPGALVRDAVAVAGGAAITGLSAQVSIHTSLTPVPFTLQTLSVVVVGAALGTIRGSLSMLLYLIAGGAGVPWFANHSSGFGGPSFGYVIGFIVAAGAIGVAAEKRADRRVWSLFPAMIGSGILIYGIGMLWLQHDLGLTTAQAFDLGVRPFMISDFAKLVVASLLLPAAWRAASALRG